MPVKNSGGNILMQSRFVTLDHFVSRCTCYYDTPDRRHLFMYDVAPEKSSHRSRRPDILFQPKLRTLIPGTDWLKVTTNQGSAFYMNNAKETV